MSDNATEPTGSNPEPESATADATAELPVDPALVIDLPPSAKDERQVTENNAGVPTQVANPNRTSWRTFVQALISGLIALNVALPAIQAWLSAPPFDTAFPPVVYAFVNGAAVVLAGVALGVTRLMAIPAVDAWINKYLPWLAAIQP